MPIYKRKMSKCTSPLLSDLDPGVILPGKGLPTVRTLKVVVSLVRENRQSRGQHPVGFENLQSSKAEHIPVGLRGNTAFNSSVCFIAPLYGMTLF